MGMKEYFASDSWKRLNGVFYSAGASVVIVGALFKIMHWPGASVVLTAGMLTEAFLFLIGVFETPHPDYHWQNVYPELLDAEAAEAQTKGKKAGIKGGVPSVDVPELTQTDSQKLSEGIKKLSETASQLSNISSAAAATGDYLNNVNSAKDALASFASAQRTLSDSTSSLVESYKGVASSMTAASTDSRQFMEKLASLNSTLASVNSSYELQLKNMNTDAASFATLSESFNKIKTAMEASVRESEAFKEQTAKLTQQVSNLNSIYGGMLNAMNIAR